MNAYRLYGPVLRWLPPEAAHTLIMRFLAHDLLPRMRVAAGPELGVPLWGRRFAHPIGLAAGFDKDAEAISGVLGLGFAYTEVGTVTPRPQTGNPKPRLFRLPEEGGLINRMGFNNAGMEVVAARLGDACAKAHALGGLVGVNLGKNRTSTDAIADYVALAATFAPLCDYLVINVSSPNTPGLRDLQGREPLRHLAAAVRAEVRRVVQEAPPPLLLKIAPDLTEHDQQDIAEVALATGIEGLVVSNTTIARPADLRGRHRGEAGGLSGRPLRVRSTELLGAMYRLTGGKLPLIGVGGVASARDAYAKVRAGASLVQLYTAMIYEGPRLVQRIVAGLPALLAADGFGCLMDAVGADHR